jgi:hypothetical protein
VHAARLILVCCCCVPNAPLVQVPLHIVHRELALPGLRDGKVLWSPGLVHADVVSWRAEYRRICAGPKFIRGCAGCAHNSARVAFGTCLQSVSWLGTIDYLCIFERVCVEALYRYIAVWYV